MNELARLTPLEARVLGVLIEKQATVPDVYPMTLNSLVAGCNQKTSRDPVMDVSEGEVRAALDELRQRSLVIESSGSRVMRYSHNVPRALGLGAGELALITALWLRGPQTVGELRINAERFHRFADLSSVEAYLEDLATRTPPHVVRLARQAGAREARWAHLYGGPVQQDAPAGASTTAVPGAAPGGAGLEARVAALEDDVQRLRTELAALAGAIRGG